MIQPRSVTTGARHGFSSRITPVLLLAVLCALAFYLSTTPSKDRPALEEARSTTASAGNEGTSSTSLPLVDWTWHGENKLSRLRRTMQTHLDRLSRTTGFSMQLSFKTAEGEFSVAAGTHADGTAVSTTDTFLFGSGTKPITALAVMQLVDAGILKEDDVAAPLIDKGIAKLGSNATLVSLFGPPAAQITVGQLLRMQSGLNDFDFPEFDGELLRRGRASSPLEFVNAAAKSHAPFVCAPGSCACYSSTNYVLAGVLLLGLPGSPDDWENLDQSEAVSAYLPRKSANLAGEQASFEAGTQNLERKHIEFLNTGPLSDKLTVPGFHVETNPRSARAAGTAALIGGPVTGIPMKLVAQMTFPDLVTRIYDQDASVLGWTCGNGVGTTREMAGFFWELLYEKTLLGEETLSSMRQYRLLDKGWSAGGLAYGAGLMVQQMSWSKFVLDVWGGGGGGGDGEGGGGGGGGGREIDASGGEVDAEPESSLPRALRSDEWGVYEGHGGMTYGFLSEQGLIPQLNATFSAVVNNVARDYFVGGVLVCTLIREAAREIAAVDVALPCGDWYNNALEVMGDAKTVLQG